ncbi:MAG: glycosyltransferase family 39 protein, partial [Candidatus Omnitrophica bacterium]|nr:glycosyltransferase family 39 protein [Candidatus Omnitrophota bacterium]
MIAFFILNASAAVTAWQVATRIARLPSFVLRCIAGGLTWFSVIVLGELLLGLLGQLTLTNLMIEQAIFACIACAVARSIPVDRAGPGPLYGAWPGFLGRRRVILLLACVLLGFGVVKAGINLVNPPFGWDSLNYHFTFPVEWMKTGTLENPITVSDDPSPPYYPINGSLLYLWLLWPFSGAFAADLGQLPFYLLGFACVYRIAGKFRLSPEYAFYAAALFTLIPNYFKQIEIAYVDVMVSSLFCAACVFLMELQERFDRRNVLFFGMSAGLLLGTKTVAVAYSILLFPAFAYLVLRHRRKAYYGIYAFLAVVMLGGFSYIRNMAVTGNPLYPFDSGLFRGVMDKATYAAHFTVADYNPGKLLFHEGLGGAVLLFVLPAVFIGLPVALWRDKKITPLGAYMTAVAPAIYLLYRFVIPLANTRYLYPAFAVGMATA